MVAIELVGRVVEPRRDRAHGPARTERVRPEQLEQLIAARRRLFAEHAILGRGGHHFPAGLERAALIAHAAAESRRRHPRQRLAGGAQRAAHVVVAQLRNQTAAKLDVGMDLHALEQAVRRDELDHRKVLGILAREARLERLGPDRIPEDVAVDAVTEVRDLTRESPLAPAHRGVEPEAHFRGERRVPDLEREVAGVRTEEVQLLERRIARRARRADRKRQLVVRGRRPHEQADRRRSVGETPVRQTALGGERRVIQPAAELQRRMRPRHFLVDEHGRGALVDRWRQGFRAGGAERAIEERRADGAGQPSDRAVLRLRIDVGRVVGERGADLIALELVVAIAAVSAEHAIRREQSRQPFGAGAEPDQVAPRRELNAPFLDDGNAVLRVVVAVAPADVAPLAGPRRADRGKPRPRLRVVDRPFRRLDISRATAAARDVQRPSVVAREQVARRASLGRGGSQVERRAAVRAVDALRGDRVVDDVHEPADGVRTVEQRRRTSHHLDRRRRRGVDGDAVIAGLAREVADALPVFEDEHAIAVQPANHRAGGTGAERALGDARLGRERRAETPLQLLREILARENRRRLIGVELIARIGADRDDLGVVQFRIDSDVERDRGLDDRDVGAPRHEPGRDDDEVVRAGRHVGYRIRAVVARLGLERRALDEHRRPGNRAAGDRMIQTAGNSGALRVRRRRNCDQQRQRPRVYA